MARARVIAWVVLVLLAACGGQPVAPPSGSTGTGSANVTGVLDRGPVPTCPADEPCDPPARTTMLIFSRPGAADVTVFVAVDGSFAVHLAPGQYAIAAAPPAFGGRVEPSSVQVPPEGSVFLRLRIARRPYPTVLSLQRPWRQISRFGPGSVLRKQYRSEGVELGR